ncbi:MAG: Fic family protein, partial [Clostridia bacterium]|nr:Fic family protein [Clostridia bacterium]
SLLTPKIVSLLAFIHEQKGGQASYKDADADAMNELIELAKIQSTDASNRIEGIVTTDDRLNKLVREKTLPRNRTEQEIAGYRDVLKTIHEKHDYIPIKPGTILQFHRDLYKFSGKSIGGSYKNSDNVIAEKLPSGTKQVRFEPVPAWEVSEAMEQLCAAYNYAIDKEECDSLLLIPMFILDFLCIHPFNDGNGRMSRLLTLLLLYRSGYEVGRYISLEKLINDSKETYYEALADSSIGWHEGENDYTPFVRYLLGIVVAAYRELTERLGSIAGRSKSKPDRIRDLIKSTLGPITKTEILKQCGDISQVTVQRALAELLKSGEILKISGGRYTKYVWNHDKEY